MPVSIKISEENYRRLCSLSGKLRERFGEQVSINDAIDFLFKNQKISDLAGKWKMSEIEADGFIGCLNKGWQSSHKKMLD